MEMLNSWEHEDAFYAQGCVRVCGVDEAGRGPLAGPVFAAAVILPRGLIIEGLNDSKQLTEKTRERLFDEICEKAVSYGVSQADNTEIDSLNILNATYLAMNRAIDKLAAKPDIALIDGNRNSGIEYKSVCIVGGDGKSASIAAASILAKVSRDRFMCGLAEKYPEFAFEKHKGYGTKLHYDMLLRHGPSDIHRRTFLKKFFALADSADSDAAALEGGDGSKKTR